MTVHARRDDDATAARIRALVAPVAAPHELRRRIAVERLAAVPARGLGLGRGAAGGLRIAVAALVLALVLLLTVPQTRSAAPSLTDAVQVALWTPTSTLAPGSGPGSRAGAPTIDGLRFPDLAYAALDLRPLGVRHDRTRGREVVVVSYRADDGARIGYAIVAAPALDVAAGARRVMYRGMRFAVLRVGAARAVSWRRAGRTCIVASRTASQERLLHIAAWTERS